MDFRKALARGECLTKATITLLQSHGWQYRWSAGPWSWPVKWKSRIAKKKLKKNVLLITKACLLALTVVARQLTSGLWIRKCVWLTRGEKRLKLPLCCQVATDFYWLNSQCLWVWCWIPLARNSRSLCSIHLTHLILFCTRLIDVSTS